jgi:hypothetical protein
VVYIFETHTDVIVKDRRETIFGQKICLSGGASNLKEAKALGIFPSSMNSTRLATSRANPLASACVRTCSEPGTISIFT